jgi:methylphosphotriester-DNA--protein-cysteine methyltransferase
MKTFKILKNGTTIHTETPGMFAGWRPGKIFGRLDCSSGKRNMKPENRVFFLSIEDAVREGYRPCKNCKPLDQQDFESVKHLIPGCESLDEFYYGRGR